MVTDDVLHDLRNTVGSKLDMLTIVFYDIAHSFISSLHFLSSILSFQEGTSL